MPKCQRCSKEVYSAEEVQAAGQKWHQTCFRCLECKAALDSTNLRDREKEIYCASCYGKKFGAKGYGFGGGGGVGLGSGVTAVEAAVETGTAAIDAAIQKKLETKYNPEKESGAREWLETVLKEKFTETTLQESLKSGERLCQAINKVKDGMVKSISKGKFSAMQRENIQNYLKACALMGFNKSDVFETQDLYEGKNMVLVIENVIALAKRGERVGLPAYKGPAGASTASVSLTEPAPSPRAAKPAESAPAVAETTTTTTAASSSAAASAPALTCPDCGAPREASATQCTDCGSEFAASSEF
jgi:hypothetical protein